MRSRGTPVLGLPRPLALVLLILTGVLALVGMAGTLAWVTALGPQEVWKDYQESWRIRDRDGVLLREAVNPRGDRANRDSLSDLGKIPQAVLAVEDRNFYTHPGFDLGGLVRALWENTQSGEVQEGASTLTMQLARLVKNHPRTIEGKLLQIWDSLRLEAGLTKEEILEAYLNQAPFLPGTQGAGAAARVLFDREPKDLTWSEAALLAGLLKAPGQLDPRRSPEAAKKRYEVVLSLLTARGLVPPEDQGAAFPPVFHRPPAPVAGHFTDWILAGKPQPGNVITSLDGKVQRDLERLTRAHVEGWETAGVGNASVVVLHVPTGEVLGLVGSADWQGTKAGAVNGALALQQPGSTLKPFAYALAFEKGWSPASILPDVETEYYGTDSTLYIPQNYSQSYRGPVTITEALASSLNIPAIRLVREVGLGDFLELLKNLGFKSLNQNAEYYGLGLVLGNGEVTLVELAGAYGALARQGVWLSPTPFLADDPANRRVLSPLSTSLVTAILSDEALRVQNYGSDSPLLFDFPLAIKTGTSSNWRDNWVVGYSQEYVVACWVGNFDDSPTKQLSGSVGAGPLFNKVVRTLASRHGGRLSPVPGMEGLKTVRVCSESGQEPGPHCPRTMSLTLGPDTLLEPCTIHRTVTLDRRTGLLATPSTPQRYLQERTFAFLPPEYDAWLESRGRPAPPRKVSPGAQEDSRLVIQKPRTGDVYLLEPGYRRSTQTIPFRALAQDTKFPVTWILNGQEIGESLWPFQKDWPVRPGKYELKLRQSGYVSDPVFFEVR